MCVCGPESARERLEHHELIRVATKYPNIAKDYFYNQKYQTCLLYTSAALCGLCIGIILNNTTLTAVFLTLLLLSYMREHGMSESFYMK